MAEANWYWAEGEGRNGPVTPAGIARLVADGKLQADDRIWKEGMAEWIPVSKVPALAKYLKKPSAGAPAAAVAGHASGSPTAAATTSTAQTPVQTQAAVSPGPPVKVERRVAKPMREPITRPAREAIARPVPGMVAEPVAAVEPEPLPVESQNGPRGVVQVSRAEVGYRDTPAPMAPSADVGYYNPTGGMPPRAAATLAKHSTPRGDVGDWPLDDARVAQFEQALKLRKKIDSAASLFRLLLLLTAIGTLFVIIGVVMSLSASRGSFPRAEIIILITTGAVCIGQIILYYFAWKGTVRSRSWAPLTMGILFILAALGNAAQIAMLGMVALVGNANPLLYANLFAIFLAAAFAYVAFKAFFAIPKYLRQPAWCQELLSKTSV